MDPPTVESDPWRVSLTPIRVTLITGNCHSPCCFTRSMAIVSEVASPQTLRRPGRNLRKCRVAQDLHHPLGLAGWTRRNDKSIRAEPVWLQKPAGSYSTLTKTPPRVFISEFAFSWTSTGTTLTELVSPCHCMGRKGLDKKKGKDNVVMEGKWVSLTTLARSFFE